MAHVRGFPQMTRKSPALRVFGVDDELLIRSATAAADGAED